MPININGLFLLFFYTVITIVTAKLRCKNQGVKMFRNCFVLALFVSSVALGMDEEDHSKSLFVCDRALVQPISYFPDLSGRDKDNYIYGCWVVAEHEKRAIKNPHELNYELSTWQIRLMNKSIKPTQRKKGETFITSVLLDAPFRYLCPTLWDAFIGAVNAGVDVNERSAEGKSPIVIALERGQTNVVHYLARQQTFKHNYYYNSTLDNDAIRACLVGLQNAKEKFSASANADAFVSNWRAASYFAKKYAMMMALVVNNIPKDAISKSQVHYAWKLGCMEKGVWKAAFQDVSKLLARKRRYPTDARVVDDFQNLLVEKLKEDFITKVK